MNRPESTNRTPLLLGAILPVATVLIYTLVMIVIPRDQLQWFHNETGPIEIITALVFLLTAIAAGAILVSLRRQQPRPSRWFIAWHTLFIIGAVFMLLEETSYGQHYFNFESPAYFEEHNKQDEMNLHNLYGDKPSSTLRRIANVGLPVFGIALPWFVMSRDPKAYERTRWAWYTLPHKELILWVLLAALVSPIRNTDFFSEGETVWRGTLSEFKELLWAMTLCVYGLVMWQRFKQDTGDTTETSTVTAASSEAS